MALGSHTCQSSCSDVEVLSHDGNSPVWSGAEGSQSHFLSSGSRHRALSLQARCPVGHLEISREGGASASCLEAKHGGLHLYPQQVAEDIEPGIHTEFWDSLGYRESLSLKHEEWGEKASKTTGAEAAATRMKEAFQPKDNLSTLCQFPRVPVILP